MHCKLKNCDKRPTMIPGKTIIGVDFDKTLAFSSFPEVGHPNLALINMLIEFQKAGNIIILWTCRIGKPLEDAINFCKSFGLTFDYINENSAEIRAMFDDEGRKITCDYYIDDRAITLDDYMKILETE